MPYSTHFHRFTKRFGLILDHFWTNFWTTLDKKWPQLRQNRTQREKLVLEKVSDLENASFKAHVDDLRDVLGTPQALEDLTFEQSNSFLLVFFDFWSFSFKNG